jgi:hypothetical protein
MDRKANCMSSIGDDDRPDIDQLGSPDPDRKEPLSVWEFFHRILSGRAEFRRLVILVIVLLVGLALAAGVIKLIVG